MQPIFPAQIMDSVPQMISNAALVEDVAGFGQPVGMHEALKAQFFVHLDRKSVV